jgi:hypothetical protein
MDIKLTPLIIFLLLLFLLIFTIIYRNEFNSLFPEKWNISEAIFSNSGTNWYNLEGYETRNTAYSDLMKSQSGGDGGGGGGASDGSRVPVLNVSPVYDASGSVVRRPEKGIIYYDLSGQPVNFPKNEEVYDDLGNMIMTPPLVGFMSDYTGYPIGDWRMFDRAGIEIKNLPEYTGPVYDYFHNLIQFPYVDPDGNYVISPIMTPEIFTQYTNLMNSFNNTPTSNKYSDISCASSCPKFDQPLDNYISDYYQHFWNENRQLFSDDYILKSSVPVIPITQCNDATNWNAIYNLSNLGNKSTNGTTVSDASNGAQKFVTTVGGNAKAVVDGVGDTIGDIGSGTQKFATTVGKNTQAVVAEVGDTIGDIGGGAQKFATTVGGNVKAVVDEVGDTIGDIGGGAQKFATTVGGDIKAVGSAIGGGVNSALTTTPTSVQGQYNTISAGGAHAASNSRGLAGNYGGDNGVNNMGYMKGTNQFSTYSATDGVANYGNNYNAKPAQSSDFMPITTDFSKFGR